MSDRKKVTRVEVSVHDQMSARKASASADVWTDRGSKDFLFREVEATVEAYHDAKRGGITREAGTLVWFTVHSGDVGPKVGTREMRHVTLSLQDAELGDLPLIALALQGALSEGIRTGSFPALDGAK